MILTDSYVLSSYKWSKNFYSPPGTFISQVIFRYSTTNRTRFRGITRPGEHEQTSSFTSSHHYSVTGRFVGVETNGRYKDRTSVVIYLREDQMGWFGSTLLTRFSDGFLIPDTECTKCLF